MRFFLPLGKWFAAGKYAHSVAIVTQVCRKDISRRLAKEAEGWFFANEDGYVFSFVNICTVVGLDPKYIRSGLKRWRQECRQAISGKTLCSTKGPAQQTSGVNIFGRFVTGWSMP